MSQGCHFPRVAVLDISDNEAVIPYVDGFNLYRQLTHWVTIARSVRV
jgi:hypothetical protein